MDTDIAEHLGGHAADALPRAYCFHHGPLLAWVYGSRFVNYHQAHNLRRAANDLALLKADGRFARLPIAASRTGLLGGMVATVGFPDIGLQGFAPKLAP